MSAFIKFRVSKLPALLGDHEAAKVYALIWTTTPWTIPANRAIAFHKSILYHVVKMKDDGDLLLVASARLGDVLDRVGRTREDIAIILDSVPGAQLFGDVSMRYLNPFRETFRTNTQPFLHADFVSEESGTGLVHMAPGHGVDDYAVCLQHGIEAFAPLDDAARFTSDAYATHPEVLEGKNITPDGVDIVLDCLKGKALTGENLVWATQPIIHKYPIDWRTKLPIIIRATAQWFANVESIKTQALSALQSVNFVPQSSKARIESFIKRRSQWCISRQRAWGVPLPAIFSSTGEAVLTGESVEHIIKVIGERGIDAWWTDDRHDPAWVAPSLPKDQYTRGLDTMDVWFDSGTSWTQIPHSSDESPADIYLEGTDQHRGWFQSSLLTYIAQQLSAALPAKAPFKTLITHGFILDAAGRKMSKSVGNVISPEQIMSGALLRPIRRRKGQNGSHGQLDAMGPDALRLWVATSDYTQDVTVSETVLKAVNNALHKYRVTFRWLLGALADYTPSAPQQDVAPGTIMDRIAMAQLARTISKVHAGYKSYDFVKAISAINHYVNAELSSFYFEAVKDPLYTGSKSDRLRVQGTCFEILESLLHMLGPVLPLLVTEVFDHASDSLKSLLQRRTPDSERQAISILAQPWGPNMILQDEQLLDDAQALFEIQDVVKTLQESARNDKKIGSGLESRVILRLQQHLETSALSKLFSADISAARIETELAELLVVSDVKICTLSSEEKQTNGADQSTDMEWCYKSELPASSPLKGMVEVRQPRNGKCPRCWRWVLEEQLQADATCQRCDHVMAEFQRERSDPSLDETD